MAAGHGLLTLLARLVSGRLLHEAGAYAKREARLVAIAVAGFVGFLTFLLGAAAIGVVMLYAVLAPRLGQLESYAVLIGGTLAVALMSLVIAVAAAKAFTRWEGGRVTRQRPLSGANSLYSCSGVPGHDDPIVLLISAVLEHLTNPRRARR